MNIVSLLSDVARKARTKTAAIENDKHISYEDLWSRIKRLSSAFYRIGIKKGQRVALLLPNSVEFICCFFALLKINAIVSPLSIDCTPYELKSIIDNLNPHAIISIPVCIEKVLSESPSLLDNRILVLQGSINSRDKIQNYHELKDLYGLQENYRQGSVSISNEHIAIINYTYRGIGYPLGAVFTHKSYTQGVVAYIKGTGMSSEQRVLSLLPLHHFYPLVGCVLAPLISGATVVISRNFMPRSILKTIDNFKVDRLTAVPSIYILLLQHYRKDEYNLNSLTCSLTGGAYMPFEVQESIKAQMGLEVIQGYGLTECFVVTWNQHEYSQSGTLGLPFGKNIQIRITGDNGECRSIKEVGEIAVKTPTVMQGYYDRREETKSVLRDGWFYTGDYGYRDEKQYLYFTGLKKNITKVGGNIVDLKEVQNVLLSHPAILDAIVHPQEDDLWGHVIAAKVVARPNSNVNEKQVKDFCGRMLSRYKIPRTVEVARGN